MKLGNLSALIRLANIYVYDCQIFDHTRGCVYTDYMMGATFLILSCVLAVKKFTETPSAQFRRV